MISSKLKSVLYSLFDFHIDNSIYIAKEYTPGSGGLYSKNVVTNINKTGDFFVPLCMVEALDKKLYYLEFEEDSDILTIVQPHMLITNTYNYRTTDGILNLFLRNTPYQRIVKNVTPTATYYGCKGLVCDSSLKPLLIAGYICSIASVPNFDAGRKGLLCKQPVLMINPEVFTNTDLISRAIVKKILPNMDIVYNIHTHHMAFRDVDIATEKNIEFASVIIRDLSLYTYTPDSPHHFTFTEDITKLLVDYFNK